MGRGNLNQWETSLNVLSSNQNQLSVWSVSDSMDRYTCVLSDFTKNAWWNRHWLRRFVDGTWYEDRTNGHALAKVYQSSRTLFHVVMYSIHVYPRALLSLAGTSRPCMTYKSNPFSVIQAGRALTVRLWSDWCFAGNVEVCTLTSHINVSGHISQPRVCDRYKTLHINTII